MRKIVRSIRVCFLGLLYFPHILFYLILSQKKIIENDIQSMKFHMSSYDNRYIVLLIKYLAVYPFFRTLFYHRIGKFSKLIQWYLPGERTLQITSNTVIGGGVYMAHPFSTVINAKNIGDNFSCRNCTTIGNKFDGRNDLRPIIGNNVVLGANVCIIGNITIGNNVIVGAGTVITKNIPDNCIVVGNPARIIKYINETSGIYNNFKSMD